MSTNKSKTPLDYVAPIKQTMKMESVPLTPPTHFEYASAEVQFGNVQDISGISDISDYELTTMVANGMSDITEYGSVETLDATKLETLTDVTSTVINNDSKDVTTLPTIDKTEPKVETVEQKTKK